MTKTVSEELQLGTKRGVEAGKHCRKSERWQKRNGEEAYDAVMLNPILRGILYFTEIKPQHDVEPQGRRCRVFQV